MSTSVTSPAPGSLELVRAFVNTRDIEAQHDDLQTVRQLDQWALTQALPQPTATADELARVLQLREALRGVLLSHHDNQTVEPSAFEIIDAATRWAQVHPTFSATGLTWSASSQGAAGLVGALLREVASAAVDGTWPRLKACANDGCQWAFYDLSRSRTGRWCSMQVCGNRSKQQRFQRKAERPDSP